jgi:hypothetical protein
MKTPLSLLILGACWTSSPQPTVTPQPSAPDVKVTLASVMLGDDCDHEFGLAPAPAKAPMPADCAPGPNGCGSPKMSCEQTSMQLSLHASEGAGSTNVRVKKVELLDVRGNVLGELAARSPAKWTGSAYEMWNEQIAPNQKLNATYALSAPDWDKLGGRWNAHSKTFQLRVTLAVGTRDRVALKQSITPAMLEPPVPT